MTISAKLLELEKEAISEINSANDLQTLNQIRVKYLGKKGPIQDAMKAMRDLDVEEKKELGRVSNQVKENITESLTEKNLILEKEVLKQKLQSEAIDVTLPGKKISFGYNHPIDLVVEEVENLFLGLGYQIAEGPEVENDEYNFEKLNLPKDHPARDMQDTFYITDSLLLRTHTSPVQVRTMLENKNKPVKIICPGKVYRRDDDDATHSHQFFQLEGLVIDENITMGDLKGTLEIMAKEMFGEEREIRMRPSYFPFTEPSVEVDVSCFNCGGKGCSICKGSGWIEVLGAGMVNPTVLELCGYDSSRFTGFAFGVGVERVAMLRYGIDDIRNFYTNDLRFLKQYK